MVIFAGIKTNVTAVQQNEKVDRFYGIGFVPSRNSEEIESVILRNDCGSPRHVLYLEDGNLVLRDVYFSGPDVTSSLIRNLGEFPLKKGVYSPAVNIHDLYSFKIDLPTIFQVERVSQNPVEIVGLDSLNADGNYEYSPTHPYFIQEKDKLDTFIAKYNEAKSNSTHGFPVLEGYMREIRRNRNNEVLNAVFGEELVQKLSAKK